MVIHTYLLVEIQQLMENEMVILQTKEMKEQNLKS